MEGCKRVLVIYLPLNINEAENLSFAVNSELLEYSSLCVEVKAVKRNYHWLLLIFLLCDHLLILDNHIYQL